MQCWKLEVEMIGTSSFGDLSGGCGILRAARVEMEVKCMMLALG